MSDNSDLRNESEANEAVQAVVDRVLSHQGGAPAYQGGAPADTVRPELVKGLGDVQEEMPDSWLDETAERISNADPAQQNR